MLAGIPFTGRPCTCGHRREEHYIGCCIITLRWHDYKVNECKCLWYEQMANLEYLEYLHGKKGVK